MPMPKLKYVKQSDGNSDTKFEQQKNDFHPLPINVTKY
jgi:hypothetical protein